MADSPAPNCCPVDTRWKLLRNILEALNGGSGPSTDNVRVTDDGGVRVTDDGGTRVVEP